MSDEFFNQDGTGNVTDQTSDTGAYNAPEAQAYNAPEPQTYSTPEPQAYSAPEPDVQPEAQSVQPEAADQKAASQEETVNQNYGSSDMYNSQQRYGDANMYGQDMYNSQQRYGNQTYNNTNTYSGQNGYNNTNGYNNQQYYNGNAYQQPVYGQATQKQKGDSIGFGIASLILGIASIFLFACCVNYILAILAIIFGIVQIVTNKRKGLAIGGIVTAAISIIIATVMWAFGFSVAGELDDPSSPLYKYYEEYMDEYTSEYEDYM